MNENAAVCLNCGAAKGTGKSFCSVCGEAVNENAVVCLKCGSSITEQSSNDQKSEKSKTAAGLFAIFLGHLGIHWFYLGFKNKGITNILLSVASGILLFVLGLGVFGFIALWIYNIVTAIQIFTGKQRDADGHILS